MIIQPTMISIVEPTDLNRIVPGQYCELITVSIRNENEEDRSGASPTSEISKIAGRVVLINESDIVVDDVIGVEEPQRTTEPPFARVPYFNRLFKTSGIYVKCTPIPGELRISRSSIRQAFVIEPSAWPEFRRSGFVRIGIDFDFNIQPATGVGTPTANVPIPFDVATQQEEAGRSSY